MMSDDMISARRVAIVESIDAAWEKHAQCIVLQVPTGCDSLRQVHGGEVMGRIGFNLAVIAVVEQITGEAMA